MDTSRIDRTVASIGLKKMNPLIGVGSMAKSNVEIVTPKLDALAKALRLYVLHELCQHTLVYASPILTPTAPSSQLPFKKVNSVMTLMGSSKRFSELLPIGSSIARSASPCFDFQFTLCRGDLSCSSCSDDFSLRWRRLAMVRNVVSVCLSVVYNPSVAGYTLNVLRVAV